MKGHNIELSMKEETAFRAWFRGASNHIQVILDHPVFFGKAECEWVDFNEVWLGKFIDLGLFKVTKESFIAKGVKGEPIGYYYTFEPTDKGRSYYKK